MSTVQVAEITAAPAIPSGRVVVSSIFAVRVRPGTTVQVSKLSASARLGTTAQVSKISATAAVVAAVTARPNAPFTATPFTPATLDGSASTGSNITGKWEQVSGPAISGFPVNDIFTTFNPPATPYGTTLVFRLTVTDGAQTATALLTIPVNPWWQWIATPTGWQPQPTYIL